VKNVGELLSLDIAFHVYDGLVYFDSFLYLFYYENLISVSCLDRSLHLVSNRSAIQYCS
jgi:hypothetical protein